MGAATVSSNGRRPVYIRINAYGLGHPLTRENEQRRGCSGGRQRDAGLHLEVHTCTSKTRYDTLLKAAVEGRVVETTGAPVYKREEYIYIYIYIYIYMRTPHKIHTPDPPSKPGEVPGRLCTAVYNSQFPSFFFIVKNKGGRNTSVVSTTDWISVGFSGRLSPWSLT